MEAGRKGALVANWGGGRDSGNEKGGWTDSGQMVGADLVLALLGENSNIHICIPGIDHRGWHLLGSRNV